MSKKDTHLHLRASTDLVTRLERAVEVSDKPKSQIVREAINEKLDKLAKRYPELREVEAA